MRSSCSPATTGSCTSSGPWKYGDRDADRVEMDYLDFIARVTAHIPDKGQVMIRYYALYSNAHRGKEKKRDEAAAVMPCLPPPPIQQGDLY
jgi:hypothetical protein